MAQYKLQIQKLENGTSSILAERTVTIEQQPSERGEENLAAEMTVEFEKALIWGEYLTEIPDLTVDLTDSPSRTIDFTDWWNVGNTAALWLEISNTLADVRFLLSQARAYKQLEASPSPSEAPARTSVRYYAHFEKMYHLNLAVFGLVKVQDLVVRLLFENFGGTLVDVDQSSESWEKKLTFERTKQGLQKQFNTGELERSELEQAMIALNEPSKSPHRANLLEYRHRVAHRIRPSVDYAELFTELEDRIGKPLLDSSGNVKGRVHSIKARPSEPQYSFNDLYSGMLDLLKHVIHMLTLLKAIPRLA
jgi:hypothetical protein